VNGDYIEKWGHCVPFVFNKLRDKEYLRFSFDSPSYVNDIYNYIFCVVENYILCVTERA